jgi:hypothetical protein
VVALRDEDVDGEAHSQNLLRLPQLPVEARRLLLQLHPLLGAQSPAAYKIGCRDGEDEPVNRALGPVLLEQSGDGVPATVVRGFAVGAEDEISGHVNDDSLVIKEPVDSLLDSVNLLGRPSERQVEPGVRKRRGLPRFGLANHQEPREAIAIISARNVRPEQLQSSRERRLHPEPRGRSVLDKPCGRGIALRAVDDGKRRGRGILQSGSPACPPQNNVEEHDETQHQQDDGRQNIYPVRGEHRLRLRELRL